jgi:hypothetical protein
MNKRIMMSTLGALLLALSGQSMATCVSSWAKVNYMDRRVGDTWTRVFVEQHSTVGNGPLYWYWTNQADLKDLLSDALNDGTTVWVTGDASSCGSSSSNTVGYGGFITRVEVFRNR